MDAVWSICEESFWGVPAHSFSRRLDHLPLPDTREPVIDLFAAETGAQLAWTRALWGDRLWRLLITPEAPYDRGRLELIFNR